MKQTFRIDRVGYARILDGHAGVYLVDLKDD